MLWSCVWGRLWRNKSIIHSPKLDKVCNIPSHPQCYLRITLTIANSLQYSKRARGSIWGERCLQRRKAERPGDEIARHLVLPSNKVLDSWRVVLQGARQKPLIHWVPALVDNIRFYHMGIAAAGIVEGWGRGSLRCGCWGIHRGGG